MKDIVRTHPRSRAWGFILMLIVSLCFVTVVFAETPGNLDTTFDVDGIAVTDVNGLNNESHAIATQQDFKIVTTGFVDSGSSTDLLLIRYNENGTLDSSFGSGGKVISTVMDVGDGVAIRQDGKIVVVGNVKSSGTTKFAVARFNTNGSLDTTFGNNGVTVTAVGSGNSAAAGVYLQFDEKIVVAGFSENGLRDFAAVRYTADGALDTTFASGGIFQVGFPLGLDDQANAVVVQLDGKIVLAGSTRTNRPLADEDFALVRLNTDGSLDTTFGPAGTGLVQTPVAVYTGGADNRNDGAFAVTIQWDGKIVAAGYSEINPWTVNVAVVRYLSDGSLDLTYGDWQGLQPGAVIYNPGDNQSIARGLSIQTDGKSVVVTSAELAASTGTNEGFIVMRLELNGMFDFAFKNGYNDITVPGADKEAAFGAALQSDGKIVMTGVAQFPTGDKSTTMRIISGAPLMDVSPNQLAYSVLANGSRIQSKSFGINGYTPSGPSNNLHWAVVSTESWLTIDQANGIGNAALNATIDVTGFANGTYLAKIVVFAGSATREEIIVTVTIADRAELYMPAIVK